MATQIIKMTYQLRRDTAANWELYKHVIPAAGEPCFELDTNILKIGDGIHNYGELEPIGGIELCADDNSIMLDDGVFRLYGFENAEVGAQPYVSEDGTLKWAVPSTETVDGLQLVLEQLQKDVEKINENISEVPEGKTLIDLIEEAKAEAKYDDTDLVGRVSANETAIADIDAAIAGIDATIETKIAAGINEFASKFDDNGVVDTFKEVVEYVAEHKDAATAMVTDIAALKKLIGDTPVAEQITTAVEGKVDKEEGKGLSANDFTDSLLAKLEGIEASAQVNVIEQINVGGSVLDVVDKIVEIPMASAVKAGVVKAAHGMNSINVEADGTMRVNAISVEKLVVPAGCELILNGGDAAGTMPTPPSMHVGGVAIADILPVSVSADTVALQQSVNLGNDNLVVESESVTLDLGGNAIVANGSNGAVQVSGGAVTLTGQGNVEGTLGADSYSMAVWANGGLVVINDGIYTNKTDGSVRGTDLIYASANGKIVINGGTFIAATPEWTLNVKDADYKAGTADIIVKGGKFYQFNPADCQAEGVHTSFVADGYESVLEGDYYVVKARA